MKYVVIDLETTSRDPASTHVVEWAAIAVGDLFSPNPARAEYGGLVKPPIAIPPETSAVHHIVDADVAHAPAFEAVVEHLSAICAGPDTVLVAHNAEFERTVLTPHLGERIWLCTYKAAVRIWPEAPGHSNEVLRYFLGHGTGRSVEQHPHSAMHDARVTEQLLRDLLLKGSNADFIAWTGQPALLPTCPLGEWRGKKWAEVDYGFLVWILKRITDREDVRFCAKAELERRAKEAHELLEEG